MCAGCGVFVSLLGVAYYASIHHLVYFVMIQIFVGIFEVSACIIKNAEVIFKT